MKPQVQSNHYFNKSYDTKERFSSYWHQVNEIRLPEPKSVLEVGIGNGFVANYLKQRGLDITTLDIDVRLNPDCVGSVLDIPFTSSNFEVVACFEVLEHLPYKDVYKALKEIRRVTKKHVILSLPDCSLSYRLYFHIPKTKIKIFKRLIPIPRLIPLKDKFDGEHYWEIGKDRYPLRKIKNEIQEAGFKIEKTYRVFELPSHRFFILRK